MRKPKFYYYNKETCKQTSLLCNSRREFITEYSAAYSAAKKNGWIDDFFPPIIKEKDYWTYEKCKEKSLKYSTKKELKEKCETVYRKILKNKWDEELFNHMITLGNMKKRLIYAQEFSDNSVYIGLTCDIKRRSQNHLKKEKETVFRYMKKSGLIPKLRILTDYIPIEISILKEKEWVETYEKNNWNVLNRVKTGGIGKSFIKWDIKTIMTESNKYKSKSEFKKNSYNAYCAMYKLKCQNIVCSHMIKHRKPVLQFTLQGVLINNFDSINDAHKKTKIEYSTIKFCCEGKYKTGCGFLWRYK
jgi:predicted GIY-YIG superfamily endonuclease